MCCMFQICKACSRAGGASHHHRTPLQMVQSSTPLPPWCAFMSAQAMVGNDSRTCHSSTYSVSAPCTGANISLRCCTASRVRGDLLHGAALLARSHGPPAGLLLLCAARRAEHDSSWVKMFVALGSSLDGRYRGESHVVTYRRKVTTKHIYSTITEK